jgi:hypothetical protein
MQVISKKSHIGTLLTARMGQELEAHGFAGANTVAFAIGAALQTLTRAGIIGGCDERIVRHGRIYECALRYGVSLGLWWRLEWLSTLCSLSLNTSLQEIYVAQRITNN